MRGALRTYHPDFPAYGDDANREDFAYRHEKISHEEHLHLTSSLSVLEPPTHAGVRWKKGDGATLTGDPRQPSAAMTGRRDTP